MSQDESMPPEIRAARRSLGIYQSQELEHPIYLRSSEEIDDVLRAVVDAHEVDIIGVFPASCAQRLTDFLDAGADEAPVNLPTVRYYTPNRDRITQYRHSGVLGTLVQRWLSGITGLRNCFDPRRREDLAGEQALTVLEFDDVYLDCILRIRTKTTETVVLLNQLPHFSAPRNPQLDPVSVVVVSRVSVEKRGEVVSYLDAFQAQAIPVLPRQIRCIAESVGSSEINFTPVISRLAPYGRLMQEDVEPVAVVAVRVNTASGPCVLLKKRTRENSRDDFKTLSMISERILLEDLGDLLSGPVARDQDQALDELWIRAGQPERFEIPEEGFRRAAQRELFITCGLDVEMSRLSRQGTCLLERENEGTYLGFFVYRLDINRSAVLDELKHAQQWNQNLVLVPLGELYSPRYRPRLNRLLRQREAWLREKVFSTSRG